MSTLSFLPEPLRQFVEERVAEGGYGTPDGYLLALVREDQKRQAKAKLEALLLEGLDSGPATPMTDEDWDEMRRRFDERHGRVDGR